MGTCGFCGKNLEKGYRDGIGLYCDIACASKARQYQDSVAPWQTAEARSPERRDESWRVKIQGKEYTTTFAELAQWLLEGRVGPTDPVQRGDLPWVRVREAPPLNGLELWNALEPAQREYAAKFRPALVAPRGVPLPKGTAIPRSRPCPRCGSAAYDRGREIWLLLFVILLFPLGLLLLLLKSTYNCPTCGLAFQG